MNEKILPKIEQSIITIEPLKEADIEDLEIVLRQHTRDSKTGEVLEDEIESAKGYMRGVAEVVDEENKKTRMRQYLVARNDLGKAIGCMAYAELEPQILEHFEKNLNISKEELREKSLELLGAFVSRDVFRGNGVGRKLFDSICDVAKMQGKDRVIICSGPRYKDSWGFYDKMGAVRSGSLADKFGEGIDAVTWVKNIE